MLLCLEIQQSLGQDFPLGWMVPPSGLKRGPSSDGILVTGTLANPDPSPVFHMTRVGLGLVSTVLAGF